MAVTAVALHVDVNVPVARFVSLVPKVEIADGDDQSQTVVSWLLILLGVTLWVMAIAQCSLEVRN